MAWEIVDSEAAASQFIEEPSRWQVPVAVVGSRSEFAATAMVVRDGVDPSTSGFSDRRSIPATTL